MAESNPPWITKLARASHHVGHLRAETERYLAEEPRPRVDAESSDGREYLVRLRVPRPPDPEWSAVFGDVLHNVHSALDAVTWAVVLRHMPRAMTAREEGFVMFPIRTTDERFRKAQWAPRDLPDSVREVFRQLQPFAQPQGLGLEPSVVSEAIAFHPLTRLREWSNLDKHRGLHPTVCALGLTYVGLREGANSTWRVADPWPWHDGSIVAHVQIDGSDPTPEFGDQFVVALEEDAKPLEATPAVDRLDDLIQQAHWVLYRVLPLLD